MKISYRWLLVGLAVVLLQADEKEEKLHYTVTLLKIPCVDVTMVNKTVEQNQMRLDFSAKTKNIFDYFFAVDNQYNTWYNSQTFQMTKYASTINQPNTDYSFELSWNPETGKYSTSKQSYGRPEGSHNIFSLLMRARQLTREKIDTLWWPVEHEGKPYRGRYLWVDSTEVSVGSEEISADHYRLDLKSADGETMELLEVSDVFSWGIVLDGCVRQLWIEQNGDRRILRAEVSVRGFTLTAELKSD